MERLTIKELAPYLPYDLTVMGNIHGIDTECCLTTWNIESHIQGQSKPLLRPISYINLKWFQDNIDEDLEDFRINCEPEKNHFSVEVCEKVLGWSALSLEEYQLFYRDHVDIHGLIDRSLALPIDGKEVETLTCGYCDCEFEKGTGGNYGEYGEVCINCYEGLS